MSLLDTLPPANTLQPVVEAKWRVHEAAAESREDLSRRLSCSPLLATLLHRRGVSGAEEARRFLSPKLGDLHDPFGLPDMERATERILRAVRSREPIAIFGDYDVDGISSTCLLHDFFRFIEYPVAYRLPDRLLEGYGIRAEAVRELAATGVKLIITVDNGVTAVKEVETANELGVDVVVTDHHQPGAVLPRAAAVVDPWAPGSTYPFQDLAGVGVTFKLVWALAQRFSRSTKLSPPLRDFLLESLALVALGTISDVVPLLGENRILAKFGLLALEKTQRPGLRMLVSSVLREGEKLDAAHIGYRIGPRINAAGRLGKADAAIRLLLTRDREEAARLAAALDGENRRRQEIERSIYHEAREQVGRLVDVDSARAIVLAGEGWHPGVIGIVASRIAEEFCRPTVLLSLDGERARGSARSIPGVDLLGALECCGRCLLAFGGHSMAAGLEVDARRVDELREALGDAIPLAPREMVHEIEADCEVRLSDLTLDALGELSYLAPHGQGNPEPVFLLDGIDVVGEPRLLGADSRHLAFHVRDRSAVRRAIAFGKGDLYPRLARPGARVSLLLEPQLSSWQGRSDIELKVRELRIH
jgi:single-stranded-DNA-specific exonuclease